MIIHNEARSFYLLPTGVPSSENPAYTVSACNTMSRIYYYSIKVDPLIRRPLPTPMRVIMVVGKGRQLKRFRLAMIR